MVNLLDAICLNKHLAKQITLEGQAFTNANCNTADGTINVNEDDANSLVKYVIFVIDKLPETE